MPSKELSTEALALWAGTRTRVLDELATIALELEGPDKENDNE